LGRYYTKSKLVEEVIKIVMRQLRQMNPTTGCDAIMAALEIMFEEAQSSRKPDLSLAKDLAGRLALT